MIITPFATEARMLFGVLYMEQILEVQEKEQKHSFAEVRDAAWDSAPPEMKQGLLGLAKWCEQYAKSPA